MEHVEVHGLSIGYEQVGKGPPLVLLHGVFDDSRIWQPQLDGLSDEFTVVAWDAPGCGLSSDPPEGFTPADYGDCLAALLASLGLGPWHVLGLSWGSVLALELYKNHPASCASLVLASAYAGWAGSLPTDEVDRRIDQVIREVAMPPEEFVPGWITTLLTPSAPAVLASEVASMMAQFHPVGTRVLVRAFGRVDYRDVLPSIEVPTLLLYGGKDTRSPLHVADAMHTQIPGSTLKVISDVGHLSNCEAPEVFNREVREFLHSLAP